MKKVLALGAVTCVVALLIGCSGLQKKGPPKTAVGAAKAVVEGLQQNKPVALWDALPASYQEDLDEILHTAAGKAPPDLWDASWALFAQLVTIAKTKKSMVLQCPLVAQSKKTLKLDELGKQWEVIIDMLDTVAKCELGKIEKAKTISLGDVLKTTGAEFMAKAEKLSRVLPPEKKMENPWELLRTVKIAPVKQEGDTATIKIEAGGKPAQEFEFVRTEGKWIPMELRSFWKREIAKLKKQVAEMPTPDPKQHQEAVGKMKAVGNALQTMIDAQTQDQFNTGLGQVLVAIGGAVTGGGTPPPGGGMQPVPAPNK